MRESRKHKYFKKKKKYQYEIRKEKFKSWKANPWSKVYKLTTEKV